MQRNIQAIHVIISFATIKIADAITRNNHCVQILDVHIKKIGRCMTPEECDRHMNASNGYNYNDDYYKGNEYG